MKAWINFSADSIIKYFLMCLILWRWKKALLQVLVMLKFRLKWQSNHAPKFLRGSVLGEMMDSLIVREARLIFWSCAFVPMNINSVLESYWSWVYHWSSSYGCRRGKLPLLQWRHLIRIIIWIESQIDSSIIVITMHCWEVLANHIK